MIHEKLPYHKFATNKLGIPATHVCFCQYTIHDVASILAELSCLLKESALQLFGGAPLSVHGEYIQHVCCSRPLTGHVLLCALCIIGAGQNVYLTAHNRGSV